MAVLHKLHTAPDSPSSSFSLQTRIQEEDALLLTEDAVYIAAFPNFNEFVGTVARIYALKEDLMARGLTQLPEQVTQISYADMVELSLQYTQVVSW
ncbi:sulfurtransferase complex subunit TusB [Aestuariibacter sp. AA17]|uniref:Sulfurtransferase complex subunit TusB n=1 Tax=Fluctibacter corallii TaxID=2984329 RepID=A0ABT3A5X9_9ALTE|nr:sulfurtransferase complex subunit TusB [Aestuariibacter sp. AA17]MCV2884081.1 sulfurtransferase complex subunit TusB [Aestuariibacter sp. AA17]